nr:protein naked cuticle homolog 2 [Odocoileus virginianus texanus]
MCWTSSLTRDGDVAVTRDTRRLLQETQALGGPAPPAAWHVPSKVPSGEGQGLWDLPSGVPWRAAPPPRPGLGSRPPRRRAGGRARRAPATHCPFPLPAPSGRAAAAAAFKRRESPEGDSIVVSAYMGGRRGAEEAERRGCAEHGARDKQELPGGDPREGPFRDDQCPFEVVLPPEKAEAREGPGQLFCVDDGERAAGREGARGLGKRRLNVDAVQCDVSVEEDNHQEWTFTLYGFDNSGKATREDMSSLMHTIYEVVDASVHHCSGSSKTLRVKLTVSPEPSSKRKDGPPAAQDREPSRCRTEAELSEDPRVADRRLSTHVRRPNADPHPCSERGPYCVDENTERRNHYLDLAGIENYASKFGPGSPPTQARPEPPARASHPQGRSRSQESDAHAAHHRRCAGLAELALPAADLPPRALDLPPRPKGPERPLLRSPQGSGRPPGVPSGLRPGRSFSFHPPAPLPQAPPEAHPLPQPPSYTRVRFEMPAPASVVIPA